MAKCEQGIPETIYLDGLDQLQPDIDGTRDLSFLPPQPPPGIVIVLGSRPDETLKPLEILHRIDYDLPPLNEADAMELWRSVQPGVADSLLHDLYRALKGNALFVHLAADTMQGQSVIDATSLIRQIEQNPSNLFGITLERIKNRSEHRWPTIWKPMLALLLVSQEPLRLDVLGDLLEHDHDTMQDAVWILGGLVSQGIDQRVALHHLLFRDYLTASVFNAREVKRWNQRLADWCAVDLNEIWADDRDPIEQARRVYARHHYITHLALAENWPTLWQVLDAGDYGEHKTRFDPSTRLYALDLDRGRESAIKAGETDEEHIQNLPRLWKYSLLRTSLASRVDQWPDDLFVVLAMLGRTQEALERIELVSDLVRQVLLWEELIPWCNSYQQSLILVRIHSMLPSLHQHDEYIRVLLALAHIYIRTNNQMQAITTIEQATIVVRTITHPWKRAEALATITNLYITMSYFKQAFVIAQSINHPWIRTETLATIATAYASIHKIEKAQRIAQAIDDPLCTIYALSSIIQAHVSLGQEEHAAMVMKQIPVLAQSIEHSLHRVFAFNTAAQTYSALGNSLQMNMMLIQAISTAHSITDMGNYVAALTAVARTHTSLGNDTHAVTILDHTLSTIQSIYHTLDRASTLAAIAKEYALLGKMDKASAIIQLIDDIEIRADTLHSLVKHYTTMNMVEEALDTAHSIDFMKSLTGALTTIAQAHASMGNVAQATSMLGNIAALAQTMDTLWVRDISLDTLIQIYASLGKIEQAAAIAHSLDNDNTRIQALSCIANTWVSLDNHTEAAQAIEQALCITQSMSNVEEQVRGMLAIVQPQALVAGYEQATRTLEEATSITCSIKEQTNQVGLLSSIAQAYASLGNSEKAYITFDQITNILQSIDYTEMLVSTKTNMAQVYASLGNLNQTMTILEETMATALSITNEWSRAAAFTFLAQTHTAIGNLKQATTIANTINNKWSRTTTFVAIVKAYIARGNLEMASNVASFIDDISGYIEALSRIAQGYAAIGEQNQAVTILNQATIMAQASHQDWDHESAIIAIAEAHIAMGNSSQAMSNAQLISNTSMYGKVLTSILKNCKQDESTKIILIQQAWKISKTRNDTWDLLPIIAPLLETYYRVGIAIVDSEAWVNEQLKRLG